MEHALLKADPKTLSGPLLALQRDAVGDWHQAHEAAQVGEDRDSAWVHAYLHRKEGDAGNAAYWYQRAGKPVCREPLETEWRQIADALYRNPR
jgi:hypothetical protein